MDQSFIIKPFHFDTEFAASIPLSDGMVVEEALHVAALRAEMAALRADHARTIEQTRTEAYLEGLAQARAERDQAILNALDALHAQWEEFDAQREAMTEHVRDEACTLAQAIGEALAAQALTANPAGAIDDAVGRILVQIARGQEVIIAVHPELIADVEARITHRQSQDRRKLNLVVIADDGLPIGDAHLRWDGGGVRLNAKERAAAIIAEMSALGAPISQTHQS